MLSFRSTTFIIIICFIYYNSFSQSSPNIHINPNSYSPNVSSLSQFGQVPVSLFNGLPGINIPIYELKNRDINIPINLKYNAAGHRPDQAPGWVGLGWSLEAGGVIVRNTNVLPDEFSGCYNDNKYKLDDPDWKTKPSSMLHDGPDEFIFNFLNFSGSFYLDHNGKWCVKSKANLHFVIQDEIQNNIFVTNPNGTNRSILRGYTKFIIIAMDGTKYTFGNDPNAIEYVLSPGFGTVPQLEYANFVANAWHLQQIESPLGTIVQFKYQREFSMTQTTYSEIYDDDNQKFPVANPVISPAMDINLHHYSINYLSFLTSIESDHCTLGFHKSISNELQFPQRIITGRSVDVYDTDTRSVVDTYGVSMDFGGNGNLNSPRFFKLDNIEIKNSEQTVFRKVKFDFIENPNERLKLSKVSFHLSNDLTDFDYKFEYNALKLPHYNKGMEDHWGFYNGRNFWNSIPSFFGSIPDINSYYQSRETDTSFLQAEILKKIIYPTKGYTEFIYEPHTYSSIVKQYPISLEILSENRIAGGLRIKKIISTDGASNTSVEKEYFYLNNFINGGLKSSGVLSGLPTYYESGYTNSNYPNRTFKKFSSEALNYLNYTDGNHVTYTEVVEGISGNGYTYFKYSNHDNGYLDKAPFMVSTQGWTPSNLNIVLNKTFGKLELERGLLLERKVYTAAKKILNKEVLEYNNEPNRYQNYVRGAQTNERIASVSTSVTFPIFTFWPYLKNRTLYSYNQNTDDFLVAIESYTYDPSYKLLKEKTFVNSRGGIISNQLKYPSDFLSQEPYQKMALRNIISPIIEEKNSNNGNTQIIVTNYKDWFNDSKIIEPEYNTFQQGMSTPETMVRYHSYDEKGNPLTVVQNEGPKTSYKWGYNKQYPIAEVKNASQNEFHVENFEENHSYQGNIVVDNTRVHSGLYSGRLTNYSSDELTCHGGPWTPVNLTAPKKFIYSGWIYSDGPSAQIFLFMMRPGEPGYFSYVDNVDCYETGKWVYVQKEVEVPGDVANLFLRLDNNGGGNVWFDDLRIHPSGAQMTTYTYEPLVGMTSQTDAKGQTTYYQYDSFQRLQNIKDQNGNIIKNFEYHYKP